MQSSTSRLILAIFIGASLVVPAVAQLNPNLQITEIMFNPKNENSWEWIEVRNTGATDLDLDQYFMQTLNGSYGPAFSPVVNSAFSATTSVPAGGTAVIYDAFVASNSPFNYDTALFREAWGLSPTVTVIAGDRFPAFSNSGTGIGLWSSVANAASDATESTTTPGTFTITGFANAAATVTYDDLTPWPASTDGVSVQWSGNGLNSDGANWGLSVSGANGATTSLAVTRPGNSNAADIASPGTVPVALSGTIPSKIVISEVLFNPLSSDQRWEWIEIYNNTGAEIDFGATPYYLDDDDGNRIGSSTTPVVSSAPNINSGVIPQGGVAVLFNDEELDILDMQGAWGASINFIPVNKFNEGSTGVFANGGDMVALWSNLANYELDQPAATGTVTTTNAATWMLYDDLAPWPLQSAAGGAASIYLTDLSLDQNTGANWANSALGTDGAVNPTILSGTNTVHPGGDIASPGSFTVLPPAGVNGDYDGNGTVGPEDYTLWAANFGSPITTLQNVNPARTAGPVDASDYTYWRDLLPSASVAAASAVPEPATMGLLALGLGVLGWRRSERR